MTENGLDIEISLLMFMQSHNRNGICYDHMIDPVWLPCAIQPLSGHFPTHSDQSILLLSTLFENTEIIP